MKSLYFCFPYAIKVIKSAEKSEEKPVEEAPVEEEVAAPKQIKREFADSHWKELDKDTKNTLINNEFCKQKAAKESTFDRCLLGGFCCLVFLTILTVLTVLSYIRNIVIIVHIVNGFQPYLPAVGASAPAESYTTLIFQFLHLGVQPPG